jgi:hypothetical protein
MQNTGKSREWRNPAEMGGVADGRLAVCCLSAKDVPFLGQSQIEDVATRYSVHRTVYGADARHPMSRVAKHSSDQPGFGVCVPCVLLSVPFWRLGSSPCPCPQSGPVNFAKGAVPIILR